MILMLIETYGSKNLSKYLDIMTMVTLDLYA